ncbi:hypothetical protein CONLIGDRAFT_187018 [Coniochaeta ligniaria NRRL 30616]|uniref:Calcineurin-like phosphoesterase domain-containing protein n=1 Tax=Coniochaeta ligniaria NRRL 30616 TaxID=1408157 RepID=A0A1J7J1M4_9PEZI|nr:hypothetical protein CONLIGDRAFT_187018 [Coniochaeta ligniaria NRRL 30616]
MAVKTTLAVKTTFLVVSDTHSKEWIKPGTIFPAGGVDVAIHCGDLTERSTLAEFTQAVDALKRINAPLKLVIAGNHDFTLDHAMFKTIYHNTHSQPSIWSEAYAAAPQDYGYVGQAKRLFSDRVPEWEKAFRTALGGEEFNNNDNNIHLLGVGRHDFVLKNGAKLRVYADPYTPSASGQGGFKFRRDERREYAIGGPDDVDVVITHGPPRGVLDTNTAGEQVGCDDLMAAVAGARPRMHCFGHIHEGWGAELVSWDDGTRGNTVVARQKIETRDSVQGSLGYVQTSLCGGVTQREGNGGRPRCERLRPGEQTLFVNAALETQDETEMRLPWVVEMELPVARRGTWAKLYGKVFRRVKNWIPGRRDA